jgi:hypothetical protein
MDFKKRLIQELKLTYLQAETLYSDYVQTCEKLAKEYHAEQCSEGVILGDTDSLEITYKTPEKKLVSTQIPVNSIVDMLNDAAIENIDEGSCKESTCAVNNVCECDPKYEDLTFFKVKLLKNE